MRKLVLSAALAALLSAAGAANAATTTPVTVFGTSFSDLTIGSITIGTLSNLTGSVLAASDVTFTSLFGSTAWSLDSVSFTSSSVGSLTDLNPTAAGFAFNNVAAGTYAIKASGSLLPTGAVHGVAFISADYTVTAVPEPESYAMLLAGLGLMGTIARRRSKSTAV